MTETYNIYEAKTHFSELVEQVANGAAIIIAKSGQPKCKMVPLEDDAAAGNPRYRLGLAKGRVWMAPDAFSPEVDKEIEDLFYAEGIFPLPKHLFNPPKTKLKKKR